QAETGQRALVTGPVRSRPDRHRHRTRPVRMITERAGQGAPGDGVERLLAVSLDTLGVRAVEREPGEELGRQAPATARVVGRTCLAGPAGLRLAQAGEQPGLAPHRGEAARAADVAGQEGLVDGERAGVDVA